MSEEERCHCGICEMGFAIEDAGPDDNGSVAYFFSPHKPGLPGYEPLPEQ
jgi:hypothetical protein